MEGWKEGREEAQQRVEEWIFFLLWSVPREVSRYFSYEADKTTTSFKFSRTLLFRSLPTLCTLDTLISKRKRKEGKRRKITEKKMFFPSFILIITTILQGQQKQGIIVHAAKITLTQEIQVTTTIHVSPTTTSTSISTLLLEGGSTLLPPLTALVPVSGPGTLATTTGISILGTYDDNDDDDAVLPSSHHYYQTQTSTLTRDSASYQPSSFSSSSSTTNTPASTTATATSVIRKIWTSTKTVPVEVTSKVIMMMPTAAAAAASGGSRLHAGVNSTRVGMGRNYTLTTTTSSVATTATKGIVLLGAPLAGQRNSTMTRSRAPWTSTMSSSGSGITASGSATATATSQSGASFGCEVDRRILVWWLIMAGVLLLLVG